MPRVDLYRNVHMGQRERLFRLAVELGAADAWQPQALERLAERCLAMTRELREHAEIEDEFIHPLLRERAAEPAVALDAEHERLDAALDALDERVRALVATTRDDLPEAQHALYLALNDLISAYLAHLHAEETVAMPVLWRHYTDEDLSAVFAAFRESRSPEQLIADAQHMLPALPPATRAMIVRGAMASVPQGEALIVLGAITATLRPDVRAQLFADIGVDV
ncbi:hemerythrin domain-containing protein [Lentzea sp. NPDC051208]|uniref:hemerythrin domain-containing protein n=1 Tax=Lentzea sp. NPDC051208 TaxID=3154642 RepID=UPI00343F935A